MSVAEESSSDMLAQLRVLSHRLSNSLEVILQAQYLLQRPQENSQAISEHALPKRAVPEHAAHKRQSSEDQKWTAMIGNAAAEAAETNREIRDAVRRLSALQAAKADPLQPTPRSGQKNRGPSR